MMSPQWRSILDRRAITSYPSFLNNYNYYEINVYTVHIWVTREGLKGAKKNKK